MANPIQFLREVKSELTKVVWPTRKEVIRTTLAVVALCLVVAAYLGIVDFGLNWLFEYILNR